MSSLLPCVWWTRTSPTAIRPWRLSLDTPYFILSSSARVRFGPRERKTVGTGIIIHLPDGIYGRASSYLRFNLTRTDEPWDEYYPLRVTPIVFMKNEYQRELEFDAVNQSDDAYVLEAGQGFIVIEFRQALTPTFLQGPDAFSPPSRRSPPPPLPDTSRDSPSECETD